MLVATLVLAAAAQNPIIEVQGPDGTTSTIESGASDESKYVDQAYNFIQAQQPAQAIPVLDGIISRARARYAPEKRQIYTARTQPEAIYYAGLATSLKKSALVLDEAWSEAYFLKGYALIDLNRPDEAKALFDEAIAMANSHYLGERGEWHKSRKDWQSAYADFASAEDAAEFSPDDFKSFDKRRAWRGMAFVRTEQGKLEEAEQLLRKCLTLDSSDEKAKHELEYIKSLRGSRS
jgi:tetratricopeptide (TPR) repeat protein